MSAGGSFTWIFHVSEYASGPRATTGESQKIGLMPLLLGGATTCFASIDDTHAVSSTTGTADSRRGIPFMRVVELVGETTQRRTCLSSQLRSSASRTAVSVIAGPTPKRHASR